MNIRSRVLFGHYYTWMGPKTGPVEKTRNFLAYLLMYSTTLPEAAHRRNRPRKSLKNDFPPENLIEWCPFCFHSHGLWKLYKLRYVYSRSIHWGRNSKTTRNSNYIWPYSTIVWRSQWPQLQAVLLNPVCFSSWKQLNMFKET